MFTGRTDHFGVLHSVNALSLELFEASDAAFEYSGRNRLPYSRIFAVCAAGKGEKSSIYSYTVQKKLEMTPGMLCFMSTDNDLEFHFRKDTRFLAFHFELSFLGRDVFSGCRFLEGFRRPGVCRELLREMRRPGNDLRSSCAIASILLRESMLLIPAGFPSGGLALRKYGPVLEYIRRSADAETGVPQLAEIAGESADSFSRGFAKAFGMTPKKCLERELARRAGKLLRGTDLRIREVAFELGFADEYYFSRFFKCQTGESPLEYRRAGLIGSGEVPFSPSVPE